MELEKTNQMNTLFEFYGPLLTEKQQQYMQLYYADDFSLGEIAEEFDVSRQAVYDNIKRTENILLDYETKLELVKEFKQNKHVMDELIQYIQEKYPEDSQMMNILSRMTWGTDEKRGA
ncbi:putative DNA-binding protein [Atopococcus tabaci]|uniref:putative DNA-binding protein n=1 Tax=Atopococcus tabaci TaxID=269774 RepID=UPI00040BC006|nr:putative DNA-binding protein [Atopococcus tabaci]